MTKWTMYCEYLGYPLEVDFTADDDMDETEVWDLVSDNMLMTLEVTREED